MARGARPVPSGFRRISAGATPSPSPAGAGVDPRIGRYLGPSEHVAACRAYQYVDTASDKEYHGVVTHDRTSGAWRGICLWGRTGTPTLQRRVYYTGTDMNAACETVNRKLSEKHRKGYVLASASPAPLIGAAELLPARARPQSPTAATAAGATRIRTPARIDADHLAVGMRVGFTPAVIELYNEPDIIMERFEYSEDGGANWHTKLGTDTHLTISPTWAGRQVRIMSEVFETSTRELLAQAHSEPMTVRPHCTRAPALSGSRILGVAPHLTPAEWAGARGEGEVYLIGPSASGPWEAIDDPSAVTAERAGHYLRVQAVAMNDGGEEEMFSEPYGPLAAPRAALAGTSIRQGLFGRRT